MHPAIRAIVSAVIIVEGLAVLWLAKLIADEPGIESFADGVRAFLHAMTNW